MKKMIAMAFVAITMMTSCSDDDSSNTNDPGEFGLLPKKMIETSDGDTYTTNISYDGNKITGYSDGDGYEADFSYSNGLLTKIETSLDNDPLDETIFTYDENNKLASCVEISFYDGESDGYKTVYDHNNDGTISLTFYSGNAEEQATLIGTGTITMVNGNITSFVSYDADGSEIYTESYTFDNKYTPFKNVFASDILVLYNFEGGVNNILTNTNNDSLDDVFSYEYTYNAENLPVTETAMYNNNVEYEIEYVYE